MPQVFMPRLSDTMTEGTVSTWTKGVGERVEKGDVIAEIETDKATMELEAYDAGILEEILVQVGTTVPIGEVIAVIGDGSGATKAAPAGRRRTSQDRAHRPRAGACRALLLLLLPPLPPPLCRGRHRSGTCEFRHSSQLLRRRTDRSTSG